MDRKDKSILYRGTLIHTVCAVELGINYYISGHFCGNDKIKNHEMQVLILGDERCTLGNKAQIFQQIATKYDEAWYNSYQSTRLKSSMSKDIFYIIEQRNIFAHRIIDSNVFTDSKLKEGSVRFIKFKNDIEPIDYTEAEFNNIIKVSENLIGHFYIRVKS